MLFWILVLVVSLIILLKASDFFIQVSEKIGFSFGLSSIAVGAIILGFGTSIPELVTSIFSVYEGSSEIVAGNAIGSNIANVLFVLGVTAAFRSLKFKTSGVRIEMLLLVISVALLVVFSLDNIISIIEAFVLFFGFLSYLFYSLRNSKTTLENEGEQSKNTPDSVTINDWVIFVFGGIGIFIGAKYAVTAVIEISSILEIGKEVIALSAVALGTSLPELVVTMKATKKGNTELAIGNILGSNIFNIFSVMSIPRFFGAVEVPDAVISFSLPVMATATVLLLTLLATGNIKRWHGFLFVILYAVFNFELFTGIIKQLIVG